MARLDSSISHTNNFPFIPPAVGTETWWQRLTSHLQMLLRSRVFEITG
jgi:hypothetical protein